MSPCENADLGTKIRLISLKVKFSRLWRAKKFHLSRCMCLFWLCPDSTHFGTPFKFIARECLQAFWNGRIRFPCEVICVKENYFHIWDWFHERKRGVTLSKLFPRKSKWNYMKNILFLPIHCDLDIFIEALWTIFHISSYKNNVDVFSNWIHDIWRDFPPGFIVVKNFEENMRVLRIFNQFISQDVSCSCELIIFITSKLTVFTKMSSIIRKFVDR